MAAPPSSPGGPNRRLSLVHTIGGIGLSPRHARRILALAGPVILGMLTQTAVNLVDTAMVGRLPSEVSVPGQAALGISLPIFWAVGGFLSAIQIGTQAIVARRFGEGARSLAGRALTNGLILSLGTSVVFSAIAYLLVPLIFPFFHQDPEVIRWGVPYLQIRMIGILSMVATASTKGFFDGVGRTYVHMVAAITMNILNIFGNWILIFGNLGAPKLMVTGAAIASTATTYIGLFIMLGWTFSREMRTEYRPYQLSNVNGSVLRDLVRLSVPSGVSTVAMMAGFLIFLKIVGHLDAVAGHGAVYSAATKVVIDVLSITFMTCMAFGTATATLVGQFLGRGRPRSAERYGWESVKLGMFIFGLYGVFSFFFPEVLLRVFTQDPVVVSASVPIMKVVAVTEWAVAAAMILMQALFGAGNAKFVGYVTLAANTVLLVPISWLLGVYFDLELLGMWYAIAIYILVLAGVMSWKFFEGGWKRIEV